MRGVGRWYSSRVLKGKEPRGGRGAARRAQGGATAHPKRREVGQAVARRGVDVLELAVPHVLAHAHAAIVVREELQRLLRPVDQQQRDGILQVGGDGEFLQVGVGGQAGEVLGHGGTPTLCGAGDD